MDAELNSQLKDDNEILRLQNLGDESMVYGIKQEKLYPESTTDTGSNYDYESNEPIKEEPRDAEMSVSCENGLYTKSIDEPGESPGIGSIVKGSNSYMLSNNTTLAQEECFSKEKAADTSEITPEMDTDVSDVVQNFLQSRHPGISPFQCSECDLVCPTLAALEFHTKLHAMERLIQNKEQADNNAELNTLIRKFSVKIKGSHKNEARDIKSIMKSLVPNEGSDKMLNNTDSSLLDDRPHKCDVCGFRFKTTTHLKRHMQTHTGDKPYACTECDYRSARSDKLKNHMQSHKTGPKPFACTECNFSTWRKDKLKDHMKTHDTGQQFPGMGIASVVAKPHLNETNKLGAQEVLTDESAITSESDQNTLIDRIPQSNDAESCKNFKCPECEYNCSSISILKLHMVKHSDERPFECTECDSKFKGRNNLQAHMQTHLKPKSFSCTECEYTCPKKAQFKRHMLTHSGTKRHACHLCDYKCNEKGNLVKHLVIHGDAKPFSCPEEGCDYKCKLKCNLKVHMLKHTGEKPFMCHLCDYKSLTKGSLQTHMFKHTGEKPFLCSVCGNRYALKGDLNVHMRIHTNNKKFSCQQCDYRCFTQQRLDQHMLTHTGEKPYKCEECGFGFTSTSHLKRHMRTHTGDKPYACTECDYRSARNDKLKIHMQAHITGQKPLACTECDYTTWRNDKLKDHIQMHDKSHMKTHTSENLVQSKQSKAADDLQINETRNTINKSNSIPQKNNESLSSKDTVLVDSPAGSHSIFGSRLANDFPNYSEVVNVSSHSHESHQRHTQPINSQHVLEANRSVDRTSQESSHQDVNYKMYSNDMEYHSLSKRYSNFPPLSNPLYHQGSSNLPTVSSDSYNYQVLSDKLLYTRKLSTHTGENIVHGSQNYSENPLIPYPHPMFIESSNLSHLNSKIPSSMHVPPNMSEMIRHANNMYSIQ